MHRKALSKGKQITHWRWGWGEAGMWGRKRKMSTGEIRVDNQLQNDLF